MYGFFPCRSKVSACTIYYKMICRQQNEISSWIHLCKRRVSAIVLLVLLCWGFLKVKKRLKPSSDSCVHIGKHTANQSPKAWPLSCNFEVMSLEYSIETLIWKVLAWGMFSDV